MSGDATGHPWHGEMDLIASNCATAHAADEQALVLRLIGLLEHAEGAARRIVDLPMDVPRLVRWTEAGAALSAMADVLGSEAGYMLSRAPDGGSIATVVIAGEKEEFTCFGETEAIALCGAVCGALAALLHLPGTAGSALLH